MPLGGPGETPFRAICQPAQLKGVGRVRHTTVTFFDQWCDLVSLNDQAANLPCLKLCVDFK